MIELRDVSFAFAQRRALDAVTFTVQRAECFGVLGPNGSGKSTLFRLMTGMVPFQDGLLTIAGHPVDRAMHAIRPKLGVVFQSPSLDPKLTVLENITTHGRLFGFTGPDLAARSDGLLAQFQLQPRAHDRVEQLSGGLKRRVELAKALLPEPDLLLLDEPSTGLDPGARRDLWSVLAELRGRGVTIVITTHLLEEAEACDRLALLDQGRLVGLGTPATLKDRCGPAVAWIEGPDLDALERSLAAEFNLTPRRVGPRLRLEHPAPAAWLPAVSSWFPDRIRSLHVAPPSLDDVFFSLTGRSLEPQEVAP